jgi:N-acetylneuraminic acid mutarotase
VVVNGKIYVMGGVGADNQPIASVEAFDPATNTWSTKASMPTPRALFGAAAVAGTIYAIGGTTMGLDKLGVVEAYDPATDTWSRKGDMPTPRNSLSAGAVDGRIYALGGWGLDRPEGGWESVDLNVAAAFSTVEIYDPETDTWATGAEMPTARAPMTVSVLGDKIYAVGGGARRKGQDVALSVVEVYDTVTNRWAPALAMPTPRFALASAVMDGRIYVTGGAASQGSASSQAERERSRVPLSVVEVYDPSTSRWAAVTDLATARGWHSTSVVDGKLYIIGGRGPAPEGGVLEVDGVIPAIEIYTPTR